ncbi:beta-galactosidase [Coraliomargarita algicola]|uniref:Beta-galactosidase n=1 Tax=Coraliomargarita algicola TaxID=3092156 RepID=A0ABZ0RM70_9BACT|nr:beta-galactosidase [Coraliomargarita sp. J2-16]WPJ96085.1 beta-galactosidase [Coraliomargarita sp. J2-16]
MQSSKPILYGGDYNPEQWLKYPEVLEQDFRLFEQASINTLTIGVFAWAALEPEEGVFQFEWLDHIFERAMRQHMRIILATPSGGKPNWLAMKYTEVRRVNELGQREPQRARHNHCLTSDVYRDKVSIINEQLAKRYGAHSALEMWHISNEFGGYCYCDRCMAAFRDWLKAKYTSLDALNEAYWSRFWSHTFTEWEQIRYIDKTICGLVLDWKRFMTDQCCSFIRNEIAAIRRDSPDVPTTTNFMGTHPDYDYHKLAQEIDVVSWDAYPMWHLPQDNHESNHALNAAFRHDVTRGIAGGKPFLLMESTPGQVNWAGVSPLMRPGMLRLASYQAIAHGSDSVCYFQMRKSRGSWEQFHGAVIDHVGHANTRVFREVEQLGASLLQLDSVVGSLVSAKVAIVFDWETRWIYEGVALPSNAHKQYAETILAHYKPFWARGINVDIVDRQADFSKYELVVAPILFMLSDSLGERLTDFVKAGGHLVTTYGTGVVNETGLAISGGMPGALREVLGVWVEEFDALPDAYRRQVKPLDDGKCGLTGVYEARHHLDLVHLETAEAIAVYGEDFYSGYPALTRHSFGAGSAWHISSRNDDRFSDDFLGYLADELKLTNISSSTLPQGVSVQTRSVANAEFVFLMNFNDSSVVFELIDGIYTDLETESTVERTIHLAAYQTCVLQRRLD